MRLPEFICKPRSAGESSARICRHTGGKLRVAFPGDSGSGYTLVSSRPYPEGAINAGQLKVPAGGGVGGTNRSGAVPVMFDNLFAKHEVPWEEVPISPISTAYSPNSEFTACVRELPTASNPQTDPPTHPTEHTRGSNPSRDSAGCFSRRHAPARHPEGGRGSRRSLSIAGSCHD